MYFALRARYVFPVGGDPIYNGEVIVKDDRIAAVGAPQTSCRCQTPRHCNSGESQAGENLMEDMPEIRDLGNVAILPGLVNAHVHLDFSHLTAPLGRRGTPFVEWLRLAMESRRQTAGSGRHPTVLGLDESFHWGVTALGEVAQPGWPLDEVLASPLGVAVFQELIAPTADRVAAAVELAKTHLNVLLTLRVRKPLNVPLALRVRKQHHAKHDEYSSPVRKHHAERDEYITPGLSPHAPYTVHPALLSAAIELSNEYQVPLAMHLAESREELDLLRHGGGPLRTMLDELGVWEEGAIPPGTRPLDYLRRLAAAHRALVIHGNYLDDEEIAFLAANRRRMAAVYCPRTHDWFAHEAYPLEKMLTAGSRVALGTDGRGSSPDLSLLAEMRFAARRHPAIGLDEILKMGTIYGAEALGREAAVGSIAPGKQADLTIVALPDRDAANPHELLFDSQEPVVGCYCRGVKMS